MKRPLLYLLLSTGLITSTASMGGAMDDTLVPADAHWAIHLDSAHLRDSELGQQLIAMIPPYDLSGGAGIQIDVPRLLTMIGNVTAFGSNYAENPEDLEWAVVIRGTEDARTIARGFVSQMLLSENPELVEVTNLPCEAYAMGDQWIIGFPTEQVLLGASSREELTQALAALRGETPTVASGAGPLAGKLKSTSGSFLTLAGIVPQSLPWSDGDRLEARILKMVRFVSLAVGERGDQTTASLVLDGDSNESSTTLQKILEGAVSMAALLETGDAQLTEFINAAEVRRDGTAVRVNLEYPTERLITMAEAFQQQAHEPPAETKAVALDVPGTLLSEWTADRQLGDDATSTDNFVVHQVEDVHLVSGSTLVLSGARHDGEHARLDYLELTPAEGSGQAQRFEAEYMRLHAYRIEQVASASDGEVIRMDAGQGNARMRFAGDEGTYNIAVAYLDETDGQSVFALSVVEP